MDEQILEAFGQTIKKMRLERGYSQEEFAYLVGIHRTYIGGIERGERNPTLLSINKICSALDLPMSDVFSEMFLHKRND